jgi:hypothetical protein
VEESKSFNSSKFSSWWEKNSGILVVIAALLAIGVYFWFITAGKWVWTPLTYYFDHLADAFLHGSTALLDKPPAALAALSNPYIYDNRLGIEYIWDASYFNGNYYLYWGPVPALFAAAIKWIRASTIDDQQLVFLFMAELAVVMAALLHWLRTTFYPKAPPWTAAFFTLAGLLSVPVLWIINRPSVYEGAIAGGQFFLILGLYAGLRGMLSTRKDGWMILAGLAWGASIGCRVNNAAAIIWLALLVFIYLIRHARRSGEWLIPAFCLGLPMLLWGLGLAGYNFARFGNILETGHRYQLTGPGLTENYRDVASVFYIIPNLYNLLARPLLIHLKEFPLVIVPSVTEKMWPASIYLPGSYVSNEPAVGIFQAVPIFWLIFLPLLKPAQYLWIWLRKLPPQPAHSSHPALPWVWWMVCGGLIAILGSLSFFIASNLRYLVDIVPLLTVLSALCLWWGLHFLDKSPAGRNVLLSVVLILGLISIAYGLLAGFGEYPNRFQTINPELYAALSRFLSGK